MASTRHLALFSRTLQLSEYYLQLQGVAFAFVSALVHFNLVSAPFGLVLAGVSFAAPYAPQL